MQVTVAAPDAGALMSPAQAKLAEIQAIEIDSQEMFEEAGTELRAIKSRIKDLESQRTGIVAPLNDATKRINDLFRPAREVLEAAEKIIKGKMLTYQTEQERIAAEARRQAEEEARRERMRIEAEAAAAAQRAEQEAAEKRAAAAAAAQAGDIAAAAALEIEAEMTAEAAAAAAAEATMEAASVSVIPAAATPTAAGISTRGRWKAEVESKLALVTFVASNPQFLHVLDVNQSALNQLATALKQDLRLDGVRVYQERTLAARA